MISNNEAMVKGKLIKLISVGNTPLALMIDKQVYPVIIDYNKVVIGLVDPEGKSVLFLRSFDLEGNKKVVFNDNESDNDKLKEIENLTLWSFGRLLHNPLATQKDFYWSQSRTYSTQTATWTTFDPLVAWNPKALVNNPGNWSPQSYCNRDPVNCVDTSGNNIQYLQAVFNASWERNEPQRAMNAVKDAVKTVGYMAAGGVAVGAITTVGPVIAPIAGELALNVGARMASNPKTTSIISGSAMGFFEKVTGEQTGLPDMSDPYGTLASEFTKFTFNSVNEFIDCFSGDSLQSIENGNSYWSSNPYE